MLAAVVSVDSIASLPFSLPRSHSSWKSRHRCTRKGHPTRFSIDIGPIFTDLSIGRLSRLPACLPQSHPHRVPAMLDLSTGYTADCSGLDRRTFLRVGGLAAFGLSLPQYLRAMAGRRRPPRRRPSAAFCSGCRAARRTSTRFDPKPDAPAEIRGEFGTIPTTLPGVRFADPLPMLAKQTDRLAVIRGHDPKNGSHGVADHLMMSGHKFNASLPFPCYGSVVAKERGYDRGMLPVRATGPRHRSPVQRRHRGLPGRRVQPVRSAGRSQFAALPGSRPRHRQRRRTQASRSPLRHARRPGELPEGGGELPASRRPATSSTKRPTASSPARPPRRRSTSPRSRTRSASATAGTRSARGACWPGG